MAMTSHTLLRHARPWRDCTRALVLGWALFGAAAAWAQQSAEPLRPEVAKPLQAAQEALRAGNGSEALARIQEAAAKPDLNTQERYLVARMRAPAAAMTGDFAQALQAFDSALASGRVPVAERPAIWRAMVQTAQRANDPAAVAKAARGYLTDGGADPQIRQALAQALSAQQDYAGMVLALQALVAADDGAGRKTPEEDLRLLAAGQLKLNDEAGYRRTLERLVVAYPGPAYWADLIARLQAQPDFPQRLQVDAWRLARQVGALLERADYLEYIDLAKQAGQPAEALAVMDEGLANGLLGRGPSAEADQGRRRSLANAAAEDRAQVAAGETAARRITDGQPLVSLGLALTSMGQTDKGLAMMAEGLARGVQRQPDEARLRAGVALWQAGQKDAAVATWAPLTKGPASSVAELARLWAWAR